MQDTKPKPNRIINTFSQMKNGDQCRTACLIFNDYIAGVNFIPARRRRQWNSRQRTKFIKNNAATGSDWPCPSKISTFQDFEIFGVMEPVAGLHITFLFWNAQRSYQDRTKPWHIGIDQSWGFLKRLPCANARRPRTRETHNRRRRSLSWIVPSPGIILRCNHSTGHLWIEDREGLLFFRNQVVVSERFWAPDMHFKPERNFDFCD